MLRSGSPGFRAPEARYEADAERIAVREEIDARLTTLENFAFDPMALLPTTGSMRPAFRRCELRKPCVQITGLSWPDTYTANSGRRFARQAASGCHGSFFLGAGAIHADAEHTSQGFTSSNRRSSNEAKLR
jgi:hypothetical protein